MAHPDLSACTPGQLAALVPPQAARAFLAGDERQALTLLARVRDTHALESAAWAVLERLRGLLLIHILREVEGTFALERADAVLERLGCPRPILEWLEVAAAAPSLESGPMPTPEPPV